MLVGQSVLAGPLDQDRHEVTHWPAVEFGVLAISRVLHVLGGQLRKLLREPGSDLADSVGVPSLRSHDPARRGVSSGR
jgi:hypothetical protein